MFSPDDSELDKDSSQGACQMLLGHRRVYSDPINPAHLLGAEFELTADGAAIVCEDDSDGVSADDDDDDDDARCMSMDSADSAHSNHRRVRLSRGLKLPRLSPLHRLGERKLENKQIRRLKRFSIQAVKGLPAQVKGLPAHMKGLPFRCSDPLPRLSRMFSEGSNENQRSRSLSESAEDDELVSNCSAGSESSIRRSLSDDGIPLTRIGNIEVEENASVHSAGVHSSDISSMIKPASLSCERYNLTAEKPSTLSPPPTGQIAADPPVTCLERLATLDDQEDPLVLRSESVSSVHGGWSTFFAAVVVVRIFHCV